MNINNGSISNNVSNNTNVKKDPRMKGIWFLDIYWLILLISLYNFIIYLYSIIDKIFLFLIHVFI